MAGQRLFLVRHGETAWTLSGQHTGLTDIPLTDNGRRVARRLAPILAGLTFSRVLTSPLRRARETCELAGVTGRAELEPDLQEWNYGDYEGLTTAQIHERTPGWSLFRDGCPGGESPEQVTARVDGVIARLRPVEGNLALFAHGHVFRVLVSRWLGLPAAAGTHFLLDPSTVSVLQFARGVPAIKRWNAPVEVAGLRLASARRRRSRKGTNAA